MQPPELEDAVLSCRENPVDCNDDDQETQEGLMSNALPTAAVAVVLLLVWVIFLYRRGRLKEDHALLWISVSIIIVLLSTWTGLLLAINEVVGATKVSDVVLASFVALLILVCIYYSVKISDLTEQNRKIAQEIAVMKTADSERVKTSHET